MHLAACFPDSVSRFPWFQSSPMLLFYQFAEKLLQVSQSSSQASTRPTSTHRFAHRQASPFAQAVPKSSELRPELQGVQGPKKSEGIPQKRTTRTRAVPFQL